VVRQDFALISSKAKNRELDLLAEKSFGVKILKKKQKPK
jgi:hypothetical protein